VQQDIVDAIKRMGPRRGLQGNTVFGGWARMALPIVSVSVDEVSKPKLGETIPAFVHCTVEVDLSRFSGEVRQEWEALREHDVVFMVAVEDPQPDAAAELNQFERFVLVQYVLAVLFTLEYYCVSFDRAAKLVVYIRLNRPLVYAVYGTN
jgi:hypothetical protein